MDGKSAHRHIQSQWTVCLIDKNQKLTVVSGFWRGVRSSLFWDLTQRRLVLIHRRFGTIYSPTFKGEDGTDGLSPNVGE